jgi:hypothetical protein
LFGTHNNTSAASATRSTNTPDDCPPDIPQISHNRWLYRTVLERKTRASELATHDTKESHDDPYTTRIQQWIKQWGSETPPHRAGHGTKPDLYCNGKVNTKLISRYGTDMDSVFPNITSFLSPSFVLADLYEETGPDSQVPYADLYDDDGHLTFELV